MFCHDGRDAMRALDQRCAQPCPQRTLHVHDIGPASCPRVQAIQPQRLECEGQRVEGPGFGNEPDLTAHDIETVVGGAARAQRIDHAHAMTRLPQGMCLIDEK
jgi:hypothetical protein